MAIQEVTEWATTTKDNEAHHPVGPRGREAPRTSLSFQELQAAIARWRDTLGSGGITVEDEGTPLATVADTLNFTGAGVTASGTGSTKTIDIPGSGGAGGSDTEFQYNNGGALGGVPHITYNDISGRIDFNNTGGAGQAHQFLFVDGLTIGSNQHIEFGDGSTYITGTSGDVIDMFTGSTRRFRLTSSLLSFEDCGVTLDATERLYFDGGGNTNIYESAADQLDVTVGNVLMTRWTTTTATLGNYTFDTDQTVGAGQDNYVLTYDNTGGLISLEASVSPSTGTFTPTLVGTTSGSWTLGDDTLSYIKIGDLVHIQGFIDISSASSPLGNVRLGNLPFDFKSSVTASEYFSGVPALIDNWATAPTGTPMWRFVEGTGTMDLFDNFNTGTGSTLVPVGDIDTSTAFYFDFTYTAA
jgi:hypothetical protein